MRELTSLQYIVIAFSLMANLFAFFMLFRLVMLTSRPLLNQKTGVQKHDNRPYDNAPKTLPASNRQVHAQSNRDMLSFSSSDDDDQVVSPATLLGRITQTRRPKSGQKKGWTFPLLYNLMAHPDSSNSNHQKPPPATTNQASWFRRLHTGKMKGSINRLFRIFSVSCILMYNTTRLVSSILSWTGDNMNDPPAEYSSKTSIFIVLLHVFVWVGIMCHIMALLDRFQRIEIILPRTRAYKNLVLLKTALVVTCSIVMAIGIFSHTLWAHQQLVPMDYDVLYRLKFSMLLIEPIVILLCILMDLGLNLRIVIFSLRSYAIHKNKQRASSISLKGSIYNIRNTIASINSSVADAVLGSRKSEIPGVQRFSPAPSAVLVNNQTVSLTRTESLSRLSVPLGNNTSAGALPPEVKSPGNKMKPNLQLQINSSVGSNINAPLSPTSPITTHFLSDISIYVLPQDSIQNEGSRFTPSKTTISSGNSDEAMRKALKWKMLIFHSLLLLADCLAFVSHILGALGVWPMISTELLTVASAWLVFHMYFSLRLLDIFLVELKRIKRIIKFKNSPYYVNPAMEPKGNFRKNVSTARHTLVRNTVVIPSLDYGEGVGTTLSNLHPLGVDPAIEMKSMARVAHGQLPTTDEEIEESDSVHETILDNGTNSTAPDLKTQYRLNKSQHKDKNLSYSSQDHRRGEISTHAGWPHSNTEGSSLSDPHAAASEALNLYHQTLMTLHQNRSHSLVHRPSGLDVRNPYTTFLSTYPNGEILVTQGSSPIDNVSYQVHETSNSSRMLSPPGHTFLTQSTDGLNL